MKHGTVVVSLFYVRQYIYDIFIWILLRLQNYAFVWTIDFITELFERVDIKLYVQHPIPSFCLTISKWYLFLV